MNDLIRPALYGAWQAIETAETLPRTPRVYDVVGPVCESADFLGKERSLAIAEKDLLCVRSCGAYAFVMGSNYNTRPRAAEVMVDADEYISCAPGRKPKRCSPTSSCCREAHCVHQDAWPGQ
jgi:diaminopimelate decarboxylase